jgi:hypothetical protein
LAVPLVAQILAVLTAGDTALGHWHKIPQFAEPWLVWPVGTPVAFRWVPTGHDVALKTKSRMVDVGRIFT